MPLIELDKISKKYGERIILKDFSMKVGSGEFIAIMGPSGSGKSTLLNIIGLLEDCDEGEVVIAGHSDIRPDTALAAKLLREKINYLFQNFALVDEESVEYNLKLALKYVPGSKKEKRVKIKDALGKIGLAGQERRKIFELSGGEQQRVAIARIMLKPCEIILADEPTGSLDEENKNMVLSMLKTFHTQGKTIIVVTHDSSVAAQCQKIVNL